MQSQWERAKFDPMTSKSVNFSTFELDLHNYVPCANFHFNLFGGASPQIGEMLRFVTFLIVSESRILTVFLILNRTV